MRQKNNDMLDKIIFEIINNPRITEKNIANKYMVSERTIRRYFKVLKDNKKIKLISRGNFREWKIL